MLPSGKIKLVNSLKTKSSKSDGVLLANRGRTFLNINEIKNVNAIPPTISMRALGTWLWFDYCNCAARLCCWQDYS